MNNEYEQTRSDRKQAARNRTAQKLRQAGISLRASLRDHGSPVREVDHFDSRELHTVAEEFLTGDQTGGFRQPPFDRIGCEIVADCLRAGRDVRLRVTGSSMLPSIWPHDTLFIRTTGDSPPSIGEIVLYARAGRLIAHRVYRRIDDAGGVRFETRGDALPASDAPVILSEILGIVTAIVRASRERPVRNREPAGLLPFALRNSDLFCRIALKVHAMRLCLARRWPLLRGQMPA